MKWSARIETMTSRANKVFVLIKRNLWNCPKSVKVTVYTKLVRPKLQYACIAWDPHNQRDKAALERIQRKAARLVSGNYDRTTRVTGMLQDLQWDTLETMRRHARRALHYKQGRTRSATASQMGTGDYLTTRKERRTRKCVLVILFPKQPCKVRHRNTERKDPEKGKSARLCFIFSPNSEYWLGE